MAYIVKSLNGNEFILAFYKEKDARIRLDDRDNLLNLVKAQYCSQMPSVTLRVYGVKNSSLREFHTVDKKKYDIENVPLEENRLFDEEIKGSD